MAALRGAKKKAAPRTVPTDAGVDARVERDNGMVRFTWTTSCSLREFTPEGLLSTIKYLEAGAKYGDDVWLQNTDSVGRTFCARIADGRLYADDRIHEGAPSAEWSELKEALMSVGNPREERGQVMT